MIDEKPVATHVIKDDDHRVRDVVHMGQNLGISFREWYGVLKMATMKMEMAFAAKGERLELHAQIECRCEKCTNEREERKRREGSHVVN